MAKISALAVALLGVVSQARAQCVGPDVNDATLDLITEFEGWYPDVYIDPVGLPTVGYGHLCSDSSCSDVPYDIPLSEGDGERLLRDDITVCTFFYLFISFLSIFYLSFIFFFLCFLIIFYLSFFLIFFFYSFFFSKIKHTLTPPGLPKLHYPANRLLGRPQRQPVRRPRLVGLQRGLRGLRVVDPHRPPQRRRGPRHRRRGGAAAVEQRRRRGPAGSCPPSRRRGGAAPDSFRRGRPPCLLLISMRRGNSRKEMSRLSYRLAPVCRKMVRIKNSGYIFFKNPYMTRERPCSDAPYIRTRQLPLGRRPVIRPNVEKTSWYNIVKRDSQSA